MKLTHKRIIGNNKQNFHIRILFVLQTLRTGGSERIVKDLCENINREKFLPYVVSLLDGEMFEEFLSAGIPTYCVHKKGKDALETITKISRIVCDNQISLINAHHLTPFFHSFFAAKKNRCKLLYTGHTCPEIDVLSTSWATIGRILLNLSEGGIGISNDVSKSIHKKFGLNYHKIYTIQNAINTSRFELNIDVLGKKNILGLSKEDRIIGSVGSLGRQKNYPNLIKAFKNVKEKEKHVKLLIIGEGKRRFELENLIKELGLTKDVILLGARLDVPELMQIMDIYCLSSDFEGIPLTLLEAMAASRPIVGTDVIGIRDIVISEKTGLLVPPNDPLALSRAFERILTSSELSAELSKNANQYVHVKHSTKRWIEQYENLFCKIVFNKNTNTD